MNLLIKDKNGMSPLHIATFRGNIEIVKYLVENGALVDSRDDINLTPFHIAVQEGYREIIEYFISKKVDTKIRTKDGKTAFLLACEQKRKDIVYYLLDLMDRKVIANTIDEEDQFKNNLLHLGAALNDIDLIKIGIKYKLDIDDQNIYGNTPLHIAVVNADTNLIKLLLDYKADLNIQNEDGNTPLHLALVNNRVDASSLLLNYDIKVNKVNRDGFTPLHYAAELGDIQFVIKLLEKRADINVYNKDGNSPLLIAIYNKHFDIVNYLIEKNANTDSRNKIGITPLYLAVEYNNLDLVKNLLSKKVRTNIELLDSKMTPLHIAVENGYIDIIKLLIENGANVDVKNSEGDTPLHIALSNNFLIQQNEIIKLLIKHSSKINTENNRGYTPLHLAVAKDNQEFVELLLLKKAKTNVQDTIGITPLHIAANNCNIKIVELLLKNGADINEEDNYGWTALHYAAKNGCIDVVRLLIDKGIDIDETDSDDWTALHYAVSEGKLDIVELIVEKSAKFRNYSVPLVNVAAYNGEIDILKYLVSKGLQVNISDFKKSPLYSAIKGNQAAVVEYLVKLGVNFKLKNDYDDNYLHLAVLNFSTSCIKLLLDYGINISDKNVNGQTVFDLLLDPLIRKIGVEDQTDSLELINSYNSMIFVTNELLNFIKKDKNLIDKLLNDGVPLLIFAVLTNDLELIQYIIKNKPDETARSYTFYYRTGNIVGKFFLFGSEYELEAVGDFTPLEIAVIKKDIQMVDLLLKNGAKVTGRHIYYAAYMKDENILELLLKTKNVDCNYSNKCIRPIHLVTLNCDRKNVKLLLNNGAKLDVYTCNESNLFNLPLFKNANLTPLHIAAATGDTEIVKILIEYGANIDVKENTYDLTPLHIASLFGKVDVVELLLRFGAKQLDAKIKLWDRYERIRSLNSFNTPDIIAGFQALYLLFANNYSTGWKPIHIAAYSGNSSVVQSLLRSGESPNIKTSDGLTPLHLATYNNDSLVIKSLLDTVNSNIMKNVQLTLSNICLYIPHYGNIIRYKLTTGANINEQDDNGWTPLHWSIFNNNLPVALILFRYGADILIETKREVKFSEDFVIKKGVKPVEMTRILYGKLDPSELFKNR
ncbi:MAG: hypothetical protein IGBAC_1445 [Ignavibacteriae bacterium]|nr:MAG: hypothetical protein IGBAC_1445 [Ignavibacteriota bacterium]